MKLIRLSFYWSQVIGSVLITIGLGLVPLIRGILNNSDNFCTICFLLLTMTSVGLTILSIQELREAIKR